MTSFFLQHYITTGIYNVHTSLRFNIITHCYIFNFADQNICMKLTALAQMVACLPLVQQVWGSIPGGVVYFHLKIFNLGARRGGDVHFLIARLYITSLD